MAHYWEEYWGNKSIVSKIVDFMRVHYFANIPILYLGDIKGKSILEAGCGTSTTLVRLAKTTKRVTGIDISKKAVSLSKANFEMNRIPKEKYSLVVEDIQKMKFKSNTFDISFNTGVIEHFDKDRINNKPLEEMLRVTKKNGKIVILVPSKYSLFYLYYLLSRIHGLNKIFPGEESHRFYTFKMLKNQLDELNVEYKIKLCYRSLFLYLVAEITK